MVVFSLPWLADWIFTECAESQYHRLSSRATPGYRKRHFKFLQERDLQTTLFVCKTYDTSVETIMALTTDSTWRQYEKAIHLWWNFCQERSLSLYEPDSANAIEFFTQQDGKVKSYSTLNMYRAARTILMSNRLGNDSDISRLFRGVAKPRGCQTMT